MRDSPLLSSDTPDTDRSWIFNGPLNALAKSPDGQQVVVAGRDVLKILNVHGGEITERLNMRMGSRHNRKFFSNDVVWVTTEKIVTAAPTGEILVWDLTRQAHRLNDVIMHEHSRAVSRLTTMGAVKKGVDGAAPISPAIVLSASLDGTVKLWDLREGKDHKSRLTMDGKAESVRDVQFAPQSTHDFAAAYEDGCIQLWDLRYAKTFRKKIPAHYKATQTLDWHPSGRLIATGGRDKMIRVWNVQESQGHAPKAEREIQTASAVARIQWRPGREEELASCALQTDGRIQVWDTMRPFIAKYTVDRHELATTDFLWQGPNELWSVGRDKRFCLNQRSYPGDFERPLDWLNTTCASFNPQGELAFAIGEKSLAFESYRASSLPPAVKKPPASGITGGGRRQQHSRVGPVERYYGLMEQQSDTCQHVGVVQTRLFEEDIFRSLAHAYVLTAPSVWEACEGNAAAASAVGQFREAQTWRIIQELYGHVRPVPRRGEMRSMIGEALQGGRPEAVVSGTPSTAASTAHGTRTPTPSHTPVGPVEGGHQRSASIQRSQSGGKFPAIPPISAQTTSLRQAAVANTAGLIVSKGDGVGVGYVGKGESGVGSPATISPTGTLPGPRGERPDVERLTLDLAGVTFGITDGAPGEEDADDGWDKEEFVSEMLTYYAEHGNVQLCATLLLVLDDHLAMPLPYAEEWFAGYIDLLRRFRLWGVATAVGNACRIERVRTANHVETTVYTTCNHCFRPITNAGGGYWTCERCRRLLNPCSMCHQTVKGLYVWCQGCGHGGHLAHMHEWFQGQQECPTGCGHQCTMVVR